MRSGCFPTSCEVCGKAIHNARGFAGHLRWNIDDAHVQLKSRWEDTYRRTLRCRKCGDSWDIFNKADKNQKRCPKCSELRQVVGKHVYEATATVIPAQASIQPTRLQWAEGDRVYQAVVCAIERGDRVRDTLRSLSITYKVFKAIGSHALGSQGYSSWARKKKVSIGSVNLRVAHEAYWAMTPDEKALYIKQKFGGTHKLEASFADQLVEAEVTAFEMNQWQSVPVQGEMVPREADIKVSLGDSRKIVVLCDGEAFHGPKTVFGNPVEKIRSDMETAEAYFQLGYSVLRYSESEIKNGLAIKHFMETYACLRSSVLRVLRTWHPQLERRVA